MKLGRLITWNSTSVRRRWMWGFSPLSLCSNPSTAALNPNAGSCSPREIYKRATITESEAMSSPMILRYFRSKASILCTQIRLTNPGTSSDFLAATHPDEVNRSCRPTVAQAAFTVVPHKSCFRAIPAATRLNSSQKNEDWIYCTEVVHQPLGSKTGRGIALPSSYPKVAGEKKRITGNLPAKNTEPWQ